MTSLTESAIAAQHSSNEIAKAALKDALQDAGSDAEKEALAKELYKEATGRFPQDSSDRKGVYIGGFVLVGFIFFILAALVAVLLLKDKTVPESLWTLSTALASGIVGGLFGYAKQ